MANEAEVGQVRQLLSQLGEIPAGGVANPSKMRVLDARSRSENELLLRQLESTWGGKNRLRIRVMPSDSPETDENEPPETDPAETKSADQDTVTGRGPSKPRFVLTATPGDQAAPEENSLAPVDIILTEDGRLLLRSEDTAALDELEELLERLSPRDTRLRGVLPEERERIACLAQSH